MIRLTLTLAMLAMAAWGADCAWAADDAHPDPAEPAAQAFRLGGLELVALRDAVFVAPNDGKVFGVDAGPAAVAEVLKAAGAPTDRLTVAVDALLVKSGGRLVLLDSGLGPSAHGVLIASLAKAGVSPESITDVLITHSHGDHVGGLVDAAGAPAFPKATIRMSGLEWAWMRSQAQASPIVRAIAPHVVTFKPGEVVVPGVTAIPIAGHTPGHVAYEIVSGSERLVDIGDTAHSDIVSLAKPAWTMGFDTDADTARSSRIATLAALAKSHELVFAPHFTFPGVGRIVAAGDGYVWSPGLR